MPRYARVVLPLPLEGPFDYEVPEGMDPQPGQRVRVPFGRRRLAGVVVALARESSAPGLKSLEALLEPAPSVPAGMLEFTRWIAEYYRCSWGEALAGALPPAGAPPREARVRVADPEALRGVIAGLNPRQARSRAVLEALLAEGSLGWAQVRAQGLSPAVLKRVLMGAAVRAWEEPPDPDAAPPEPGPELNAAQAKAAEALAAALEGATGGAFLLHGITGSGKTEVYLRAIGRTLELGGGAIVLVPEIALTPQTWNRFEARLPGRVAVLHSGLSRAQRARAWEDLKLGRRRVALGPRSALFAPVRSLKLVVVDEESEPSYKQENDPRYHARDAALVRARLEGAVCVLGSATPSFEAFHNASTGKLRLLELPGRAGPGTLPVVEFVDLAAPGRGDEGGRGAGEASISPELAAALRENLAAGRQSLLFLNRRGFAPVWACAACGRAVDCGHCSVPMTLHREPGGGAWLRCHLCGRATRPPRACPEPKCGRPLLRAQGAGTQRLEEEVRLLLPGARVRRVDRDTAGRLGFHDDLDRSVRSGAVDVLLGTQMLAKGLDFPNLTLVGVINADASLSFPDFRAAERTFQILVQVADRAGRAGIPGRVLVQTRQPENGCLRAAALQDFRAFYEDAVRERREFGYPPFGRLASLILRGRDKERTLARAEDLAGHLVRAAREAGLAVETLGPAPSPLVLVNGWWRYRILLKSRTSRDLHKALKALPAAPSGRGVELAVDVDPLNFM